MEKSNINWDKRRFYAAVHILAGMNANSTRRICTSSHIQEAVKLADNLIDTYRKNRDAQCAEHYL